VAYALSRAVVLVVALLVGLLADRPGEGPWPDVPPPRVAALEALNRWDGAWYLDIAGRGYADGRDPADSDNLAFFPLYPLLVRGVAPLGVPLGLAGVLVTTASGALAAAAVALLARRISGAAAARRTAFVFCFFPGAMVLSMAYAEGLTIAAAAACLLALLDRRWALAGAAAAVAGLTRPNGSVLVVVCLWAAVAAWRRERDRGAVVAPVLACTGVTAYFAFVWARTGDVLGWFAVQREAWGDYLDPGLSTVERFLRLPTHLPTSLESRALNDLVWVLGTLAVAGGVVLLLRWRPPAPVAVYGLVATAMVMASHNVGPRPRMLLAAFPLVMAAAVELRGRSHRVLVLTNAVLLAVLTAITLTTLAAVP